MGSNFDCIDEFAFCVAGMDVVSVKGKGDFVCAEGLDFQRSSFATVNRVCVRGIEDIEIDLGRTSSDLFIRRKAEFDRTVFDLRMIHQVMQSIHNFCNTGFVVCTKQGGAVTGNDIEADHIAEHRIFCRCNAQ